MRTYRPPHRNRNRNRFRFFLCFVRTLPKNLTQKNMKYRAECPHFFKCFLMGNCPLYSGHILLFFWCLLLLFGSFCMPCGSFWPLFEALGGPMGPRSENDEKKEPMTPMVATLTQKGPKFGPPWATFRPHFGSLLGSWSSK